MDRQGLITGEDQSLLVAKGDRRDDPPMPITCRILQYFCQPYKKDPPIGTQCKQFKHMHLKIYHRCVLVPWYNTISFTQQQASPRHACLPVMEDTLRPIPWSLAPWLDSARAFLQHYVVNGQIHILHQPWVSPTCCRRHDCAILDDVCLDPTS